MGLISQVVGIKFLTRVKLDLRLSIFVNEYMVGRQGQHNLLLLMKFLQSIKDVFGEPTCYFLIKTAILPNMKEYTSILIEFCNNEKKSSWQRSSNQISDTILCLVLGKAKGQFVEVIIMGPMTHLPSVKVLHRKVGLHILNLGQHHPPIFRTVDNSLVLQSLVGKTLKSLIMSITWNLLRSRYRCRNPGWT